MEQDQPDQHDNSDVPMETDNTDPPSAYFHMVPNGHNVSTSIWYELVIVYSISIWYEMVTMYLLPYGTKWSQCIYFHMVRIGQ